MAKQTISQYLAECGRRGGNARSKKLTAAQRTAIARKAARARWGKRAKR